MWRAEDRLSQGVYGSSAASYPLNLGTSQTPFVNVAGEGGATAHVSAASLHGSVPDAD